MRLSHFKSKPAPGPADPRTGSESGRRASGPRCQCSVAEARARPSGSLALRAPAAAAGGAGLGSTPSRRRTRILKPPTVSAAAGDLTQRLLSDRRTLGYNFSEVRLRRLAASGHHDGPGGGLVVRAGGSPGPAAAA